jgi:glycosyltransferase involved in cell wall biosynthesis
MNKITIVTVVYNGKKFIEKTINSVLNQTYTNIEYIIIDGNSTDGTKDIIYNYTNNKNVRIYSENDNGIYDAMNKGINLATGDWINFMNAGDIFFNDEIIENIFLKNNYSANVIYGDLMVTYKNFSKIQKAKNLKLLKFGMCFSHQSTFFNATFHKHHPYDIKLKLASDYNFIYYSYISGSEFNYINLIISNVISDGIADANRFKTIKECWKISKKYNNIYNILPYYFKIVLNTFLTLLIKKITPSSLHNSLRKLKLRTNLY